MSYSNRSQITKQSLKRQQDALHNHKKYRSKQFQIKRGQIIYDDFNKITVNSPCAFHSGQRITNFCKNKQCLLPLCPKCVKVHLDQHVKMDIFGEFDTIQQSLKQAEKGIQYSFQKMAELYNLLTDLKGGYQSKINQQRRKLSEAKNYFIENIQKIFVNFEKALIKIENKQNEFFLQQIYNRDTILTYLTQHFEKCNKSLRNNQTLMQGIINYFSQAQEIQKIEVSRQKLQKILPETATICYYPQQLDRMDAVVKRFLHLNKLNDEIWQEYKKIVAKDEKSPSEKPKSSKKNFKISPIKKTQQRQPKKMKQQSYKSSDSKVSKNAKINELTNLESNLHLGKFRSPLDNFSLSNNRKNKQH